MHHPSNKPTLDNLDDLFSYHPPDGTTEQRYVAINNAAKEFARIILTHAPDCADRAAAVRLVREARMVANAAIACAPPDKKR